MTPTQIKLAVYGGLVLLAWLLSSRKDAAPKDARNTRYLDIEANVLNPNFGLTDAEIAAGGAEPNNPAVDPTMRELIRRSNAAIASDDVSDDQ